jgi:hypothetical protein
MKHDLTIPVDRERLEEELTEKTLARTWRDVEIHFVKKKTAPNTLKEINRISAIMFNLDGPDGDKFDDTYPYIVTYDRVNREVLSFYRYIICQDAIYGGWDIRLSTYKYFKFSSYFRKTILPSTIEFGRSVVNKTAKRQDIGLQAVWLGLGILVYEYHLHPKGIKIDYFFGKFSLQWSIYNAEARDMILGLFKKHFSPPDNENIDVIPRAKFATKLNFSAAQTAFTEEKYKGNQKKLHQYLDSVGMPVARLAESYANMGVKYYGTADNPDLLSWESTILQDIGKIPEAYLRIFVADYVTTNPALFIYQPRKTFRTEFWKTLSSMIKFIKPRAELY